MINRGRDYIDAKIKFLEHRIFILKERIKTGGNSISLETSEREFADMLADYRELRRNIGASGRLV